MSDKRTPTLADRFMALPPARLGKLYHPAVLDQLRRGIRNAEKFAFDEAAARTLAHVVMEVPELLVREHRFAVAPFPLTWIEFPGFIFWDTLRAANPARYASQGAMGDPATADLALGFLIDHDRVNLVVEGPRQELAIHLLQYRLRSEWPLGEQLELARLLGCSRLGLDQLFWGSTWDQIDPDSQRLLRGCTVCEPIPLRPGSERMLRDGAFRHIARGAAGELRTLVALLLMLNRPSMTRYSAHLPNSRGFIRARSGVFMRHRTVAIDLDPVPRLRLVGTPGDDPDLRARHRVRGHYCHDKAARDYRRIAGCVHAWQETHADWSLWADAPVGAAEHWLCESCGGKRWWREDHMRGSAALGFVDHDYAVTASR
jgi:hypothetical protein